MKLKACKNLLGITGQQGKGPAFSVHDTTGLKNGEDNMKFMKRIIPTATAFFFTLFLGTLLTGCKTIQESMIADGYRELRGDELKKLVIGNSVKSSTGWKDTFKTDGIFSGNSPRSGSYKGSWSFSTNGQLCIIKNHPNVPNGCTMVFKNYKTGEIKWFEADNNSYGVEIIPDNSMP